MKVRNLYKKEDVCELLHINSNTLATWIHEECITPAVRSSQHGSTSYFSIENIHEIALMMHLISFGVTRRLATKLMKDPESIVKEVKEGCIEYKINFKLSITTF